MLREYEVEPLCGSHVVPDGPQELWSFLPLLLSMLLHRVSLLRSFAVRQPVCLTSSHDILSHTVLARTISARTSNAWVLSEPCAPTDGGAVEVCCGVLQ